MAQAKTPGAKRAKKVVEAEGVAHITATFNNTLITITDSHGNAITWGSAGKAGLQGLQEVHARLCPRPWPRSRRRAKRCRSA